MESKKTIWYSIIRYTANFLTGEILNVGLIMHLVDDKEIKFLLIDENTNKIRTIEENFGEVAQYKSFKDTFEFYLKNNSNVFGVVGNVYIASPDSHDYIEQLYNSFKSEKLHLSEPSFSLTNDPEKLFNILFETYIGKNYLNVEHKEVSVKKYMKNIFEHKQLLGKKVASDIQLSPIKNLSNIKINVDFAYQNGTWNYLQAVPSGIVSKPTDWFARTKLIFDNLKENDFKLTLLYRSAEYNTSNNLHKLFNFFNEMDSRVTNLNLDDNSKVENLCDFIQQNAHNLSEVS